jgi:hypothetical protein
MTLRVLCLHTGGFPVELLFRSAEENLAELEYVEFGPGSHPGTGAGASAAAGAAGAGGGGAVSMLGEDDDDDDDESGTHKRNH